MSLSLIAGAAAKEFKIAEALRDRIVATRDEL
jgi:hypothetical protein